MTPWYTLSTQFILYCTLYSYKISPFCRGWQSYDAVDWAPVCPQPIKYVGATKNAPLMDEDCLYLNIFTPTVESTVSLSSPIISC
jgi:carboxylesterase type B